jgi:putative transposase
MTERAHLLALYEEGLYTMTELCERFSVSRKTAYKWLRRYRTAGVHALVDRSRASHHSPQRTAPAIAAALVHARQQHPHWGPKKLVAYLQARQPEVAWPAASTAGDLLKRAGLVPDTRRRRKATHPGSPPVTATTANQVWCADFKGEFRTGDGVWCYPLTVSDAHTRYLLACHALTSTEHAGAKGVFTSLFAAYGLPEAVRTDNGTPFASRALGGLSRLNAWWIKLGIQHQRITPGHPEQNGRHERMHRTLKAETTRPPASDLSQQQERFAAFQECFNQERPHEALGQRPPGTLYTRSVRVLPEQLPAPEYPGHFLVRHADANGCIKFRNRVLFVTTVLTDENLGLEEVEDGIWSVYFYDVLLGRFTERTWEIVG